MINRLFQLKEHNTDVKTEIIAGITTFITMAYIIFVNPSILGATGMDTGAVMVATILSAAITTIIMGLYANYPFALAPGMGLNAFFAFSVVLGMGYTWQQALGAILISGIIFVFITITGLRETIVNAIPFSLKNAIGAGIGLFIALIGFINAGIIVGDPSTTVALGNLTNPNTLLAIVGLAVTSILMVKNIKGAILIGIFVTTLIGIPMGVVTVPAGFIPFSMPPSLTPTFAQLDLRGLLNIGGGSLFDTIVTFFGIVLAFTYVDMLDTVGTVIGTATKAKMLDENGKLPRMNKVLLTDAVGTCIGAVLGTSTVTTYVESASGIAEGGKTGLTAITTGVLFLLALFIAPIVGLVPGCATAPALIIVGVLMMESIVNIDFSNFAEALPAFMVVSVMAFSYSIANGIAAGLIFYPLVKVVTGKTEEVHPIVYVLALLFIIRFATF